MNLHAGGFPIDDFLHAVDKKRPTKPLVWYYINKIDLSDSANRLQCNELFSAADLMVLWIGPAPTFLPFPSKSPVPLARGRIARPMIPSIHPGKPRIAHIILSNRARSVYDLVQTFLHGHYLEIIVNSSNQKIHAAAFSDFEASWSPDWMHRLIFQAFLCQDSASPCAHPRGVCHFHHAVHTIKRI